MRRNGVDVCRMLGLVAAAGVLMLVTGSTTSAQCSGPDCSYSLSYFSNAHTSGAPDATLRLVNDGFFGASSPVGDACESMYVFDNAEELIECCSCKITPNGLLTLSVNTNLTSNTLTKVVPTRGVIKVISGQAPSGGICDPTAPNPDTGIHGWVTHIQKAGTTFSQTEEELTDSTLGPDEFKDLGEDCRVLIELGSGQGRCTCGDAGR